MKHLPAIILFVFATVTARAESMIVDGYAAIVDDHVITVSQVMEVIMPIEQQLRLNYSGSELAAKRVEAFSNGVQRLVEQQLVVEEFKKNGGQIPDRLIEDRVNEIIHDRFDGNRSEFMKTLALQRLTLDEWREGVRDRIVVQMLRRQEVNDRIRITPADVRAAYEKQKAARFAVAAKVRVHAIVLHKGSDAETRRQDAVLLRGKIIGGESFDDMARQHSEGIAADRGGDWGWIDTADWRKELKSAVDSLKAGELSEVVDAGDDYFLLRLDERQEASVLTFDQVRTKIEDELRDAEAERLFNAWIERLKLKHSVHVFPASAS